MPTQAADRYLSTAFYSQYNLILLGGSVLFSLASASPIPLAIGAAAELCWLGIGPRLPAFRRRVDDTVEGERRALVDEEVMQGLRALTPEHAARVRNVGQSISWIMLRAEGTPQSPEERATLVELESLGPTCVRLGQLSERLTQRLEELRLAPPEIEVAELSRAYAAEKDLALRFTLHQGIKAAQKKIELQGRWAETQRQAELKLTLVEQSLSNLVGQQQLGLAGPELAREIQGVLAQVVMLPALEADIDG
jgi:hypothetical protein